MSNFVTKYPHSQTQGEEFLRHHCTVQWWVLCRSDWSQTSLHSRAPTHLHADCDDDGSAASWFSLNWSEISSCLEGEGTSSSSGGLNHTPSYQPASLSLTGLNTKECVTCRQGKLPNNGFSSSIRRRSAKKTLSGWPLTSQVCVLCYMYYMVCVYVHLCVSVPILWMVCVRTRVYMCVYL